MTAVERPPMLALHIILVALTVALLLAGGYNTRRTHAILPYLLDKHGGDCSADRNDAMLMTG